MCSSHSWTCLHQQLQTQVPGTARCTSGHWRITCGLAWTSKTHWTGWTSNARIDYVSTFQMQKSWPRSTDLLCSHKGQNAEYVILCPGFSCRPPNARRSQHIIYTVSSKSTSDIFDRNLKINYQILIIFGTNILDTTCHQMTIQFSTLPNVCFCTTWRKHNQRNITFYPMRYDCLINITRKNTFCLHFWHVGWHFIQLYIFQLSAAKIAWIVGPLCEHRQGDAFCIHWQHINNVLLQINPGCYQSLLDFTNNPKLHLVDILLHDSQTL